MHRAVDYAYNREKGGERMKIAIVTGASSGLGMAFVRRLDALGGLDEIWGVARRGERLEALAAELRTPMRPLALDLTRLESVETLRVLMREEAPEVAVLVNAAGFGKFGTCAELTLQETCGMIDLNCRGLVDMTRATLPGAGDLLLRRLSAPARLQCLRRHQGISAPVQPRPALGGGAAGHPGDGGVPRVDQDRFHGRG